MRAQASLLLLCCAAAGCIDASRVSGTVAGRELRSIEPPVYASVTEGERTSLHVVLTTVDDPCDAETAWLLGQAEALETLQREVDAANDQQARAAAGTTFTDTLDELERDYAGFTDASRTLLIWADDADAPLADEELVQRSVGEQVTLGVCIFEGGELLDDACYPGVEGDLFLEPFGGRFRGEGTVAIADPEDSSDPEGEVTLFFDARRCEPYEAAATELYDEMQRAASLLESL